jgi:hypothetical protein
LTEEQSNFKINPKDAGHDLRSDYIRLFDSATGRRILAHLYRTFCIAIYDPLPHALHFKAGQDSVVKTILHMAGKIEVEDLEKLIGPPRNSDASQ